MSFHSNNYRGRGGGGGRQYTSFGSNNNNSNNGFNRPTTTTTATNHYASNSTNYSQQQGRVGYYRSHHHHYSGHHHPYGSQHHHHSHHFPSRIPFSTYHQHQSHYHSHHHHQQQQQQQQQSQYKDDVTAMTENVWFHQPYFPSNPYRTSERLNKEVVEALSPYLLRRRDTAAPGMSTAVPLSQGFSLDCKKGEKKKTHVVSFKVVKGGRRSGSSSSDDDDDDKKKRAGNNKEDAVSDNEISNLLVGWTGEANSQAARDHAIWLSTHTGTVSSSSSASSSPNEHHNTTQQHKNKKPSPRDFDPEEVSQQGSEFVCLLECFYCQQKGYKEITAQWIIDGVEGSSHILSEGLQRSRRMYFMISLFQPRQQIEMIPFSEVTSRSTRLDELREEHDRALNEAKTAHVEDDEDDVGHDENDEEEEDDKKNSASSKKNNNNNDDKNGKSNKKQQKYNDDDYSSSISSVSDDEPDVDIAHHQHHQEEQEQEEDAAIYSVEDLVIAELRQQICDAQSILVMDKDLQIKRALKQVSKKEKEMESIREERTKQDEEHKKELNETRKYYQDLLDSKDAQVTVGTKQLELERAEHMRTKNELLAAKVEMKRMEFEHMKQQLEQKEKEILLPKESGQRRQRENDTTVSKKVKKERSDY